MSFVSGQVYVLPKKLDEKVARLHLKKVGVKLSVLNKAQADYRQALRGLRFETYCF